MTAAIVVQQFAFAMLQTNAVIKRKLTLPSINISSQAISCPK